MRDYFGGNGCEIMDAFAVVITARKAARGQKARPGDWKISYGEANSWAQKWLQSSGGEQWIKTLAGSPGC